jgi:hypothetical protein
MSLKGLSGTREQEQRIKIISQGPFVLNLISFIAFYSAKKDLSMILNRFLIIVAKVN